MKRYAPDRTSAQPKPVERVEVNEGQVKARIILLILAVVISLAAFGWFLFSRTNVANGWREIEVASSGKMNASQSFRLDYYLGGSGISAAAELKAVTALYTQATEDAYIVFNAREYSVTKDNLHQLSKAVNTPVKVHPALYQALEKVVEQESRYLYLAPVYTEYNSLFFCNDDWETTGFDPYQNADIREYAAQVAAFAASPEHVRIELLGDNTAQLTVSEAYAAFATENGIDCFADFYWMKNAFIIDYLAQVLEENGYNRGALSSYDGFSRCLSEARLSYSQQLFDLQPSGKVYRAARMNYPGGTSLVCLRSFPLNPEKELFYYQFADGTIRTAHADLADGLSKTAIPTLVATSPTATCTDILLKLLPIYIAENWNEEALRQLPAEEIYPVYTADKQIYQTSPYVTLDDILQGYQAVNP